MLTHIVPIFLLLLMTAFVGGKGKVIDGTYISAKKDFSFEVPTEAKSKIKETRTKDQILVAGHNGETGFTFEQILLPQKCIPFFEQSDEKALADFFGKAVMANLHTTSPEASVKVVYQLTFDDQPAHFAIIEKPSAPNGRTLEGMCVLRRGDRLFVVTSCLVSQPAEDDLDHYVEIYKKHIRQMVESFQAS